MSWIGELGLASVIFAVVLASLQSIYYVYSRWYRHLGDTSITLSTRLIAFLSLISFSALAVCFLTDQFTFAYVAANSNSQLPTPYKLAAAWGGHQGSMLFWVVTLSSWSAMMSFAKGWRKSYQQDVLWIMGLLTMAFGWFTLLGSNPFEYASLYVEEGRDLNPMLQDIGLIVHPPLLYLGYIGYSTVLAFACAALLQQEYFDDWVVLAKPWAISAWIFLSSGIILGSWWAYKELGWGGWWFWDPVENASLLPWLTGTALLHSLVATERFRLFPQWSISLSFISFSLSILGTFIVRSGILTSVHAFSVSPGKGIALLGIFSLLLFGCFLLLIFRGEKIEKANLVTPLSRGYLLLVALGVFTLTAFIVFLGTFYPMVYELLKLGNISVGAPYFNTFIAPIASISLLFIGMVPLLKWRKGALVNRRQIAMFIVLSVFISSLLYHLQIDDFNISIWLVWCLASWVAVTHIRYVWHKKQRALFMALAHIGFTVSVVGAVMNAEYSFEMNRRLEPGSVVQFSGWKLSYLDTHWYNGANYTAEQGEMEFSNTKGQRFVLTPERRHYPVRVMNMSEPAIQTFWHGDYYVTLGEKVSHTAYAVKIQYKAYIWWVWLGVFIAMTGGAVQLMFSIGSKVANDD
ncbi:MAG: heme lyase CcmF/NrfE family subunit [Vibrio sp.]|uniref:heme lyase CcmF/NrfE family subunit n=1 Tax=Vibrio sp. TaxID=678 RepID=UPI003A8530FE